MAVSAFVALIAALELPTRCVGEPYLLRVRRYAARVGRFVPGLGRLR